MVLAIGAGDIFLTVLGQNSLALYYVLNSGIFLAITLIFKDLKPVARRNLNALGVLFFIGIITLVIFKII